MTTVTVDDRTWSVRGRDNRDRFHRWLVDCQHGEAANAFTSWRAARLGTNVAAASVIGLPGAPVAAALAGMSRDEFVRALEADPVAGTAGPPATRAEPGSAQKGLITQRRPRVLAVYALPEDNRMVRVDTPRREVPELEGVLAAEWAPYHTVESIDAVREQLAEVDDPAGAALLDWLDDQGAGWVGWHLERRDPDHPERPSAEALAEVPSALVFYPLDGPIEEVPEGVEPLVLFSPLPDLADLDPDVPPHLTVASRAWLKRHLAGPVDVVDSVLAWMEAEEVDWVGWQWEARTP